MTTNEIAVARKAIKNAIKSGEICKEVSGMHRVGIEAIKTLCKNETIANDLAWQATKDVMLAS